MIRYVVRPPSIHKTPRLLAERLDASTRRSDFGHSRFDPSRDLFLAYPNPSRLGSDVSISEAVKFRDLYSFANANKASQRTRLQRGGVPVPATATTHAAASDLNSSRRGPADARVISAQFIVRPYRHQGGSGYRLTNDPTDFTEGAEYIQTVFPKDREYRVIYAYGDPLITLLKKAPEGARKEEAWNHQQGARFLTVTKPKNDRLATTDFYQRMSELPIIKFGHIIAADILWSDDHGYVVCELNTCPGLNIPGNLERIVNHVQGHRRPG